MDEEQNEMTLVTDTRQLVRFLRLASVTLEAHIQKVEDLERERDEAVAMMEDMDDDVQRMRSALNDIEGTVLTVDDLI